MFESEPMQSGIERSRTAATRRKPSPRSASVVGQAQMRAPAPASRSSSSSFACVAWTIVVRAVRQPVSASSSIGRQSCSSRHSSISRGCSSAWMWSGSSSLAAYRPISSSHVAGAGADGVGGNADGDAGSCAATRPRRGRRRPTAAACGRGRRARRRRGGARTRCPPRRPPRPPRTPRRRRGSGTRRPPCTRRRASPGTPRRSALRTDSGVARSASSSIPSRHVQKSVPAARPRSARWKAWLWLLTKPGRETGRSRPPTLPARLRSSPAPA